MKKTPAILMTTALLSVPCAEGVAQKSTTADSIIKTALMRCRPTEPCKELYYKIIADCATENGHPCTPDDISDDLNFFDDLGFDSMSILELFEDIVEKIFIADEPTQPDLSDLTVGELWDIILELWEELYGEAI